MYLPPVTIAYSQKAPITRQMAAMIERITQKITLRGLAAMLRLSVDGPQPHAGPSCAQCGIGMPNATVEGINGEPGHTCADQAGPCASCAHQRGSPTVIRDHSAGNAKRAYGQGRRRSSDRRHFLCKQEVRRGYLGGRVR